MKNIKITPSYAYILKFQVDKRDVNRVVYALAKYGVVRVQRDFWLRGSWVSVGTHEYLAVKEIPNVVAEVCLSPIKSIKGAVKEI